MLVRGSCAALIAAAIGCGPPGIPIEVLSAGTETSSSDVTSQGTEGTTTGTPEAGVCASELDILFVIDNSGSMSAAQVRLATSLPALLEPLDEHGVDWRVAVTTSDDGNEWCPPDTTTPERGAFVASSCRTRLGDFLFNNGTVDVTEEACLDVCALDSLAITPTTTELDPSPAPRAWIESVGGQINVAAGTAEQALRCMLPQGINGCGFESPLEASYLALARAQTEGEPNYGFMRSSASLLVVFVSDEIDCSTSEVGSEIFAQDGNRVFWSDPDRAFPTSAVCWNAGVSCVGDPGGYDACNSTNKSVDGNADVSDDDAVLYPTSRYLELFESLAQDKLAQDPDALVRVALIAGINADGSITYSDGSDPDFIDDFGIGPGCAFDAEDAAVPPVRMRELVEDLDGTLGSVCDVDFSSNLDAALAPFFVDCP